MAKNFAVVIATNRPDSFTRWFNAWKHELRDVSVYVVEDQPKITGDLGFISVVKDWHHYSWEEIDKALGKKSWVIPRRTSAIKSYGFLKACQDGAEYIWTLDDDCFPEERPYSFSAYPDAMRSCLDCTYKDDSWYNTLSDGSLYPRGYPYGIRQDKQEVMIHHGMWSGVPDLDGITALEHHKLRLKPAASTERVPTGKFFAMCGMNLAFKREMAPAMYFGLQGHIQGKHEPGRLEPAPYDRFDDIWAGLFAKKVCDSLGYAVTTGAPSIIHTKESDPVMRVTKEGPGIAANELLWPMVRAVQLPTERQGTPTVAGNYSFLAAVVDSAANELPNPDYWKKLASAMQTWTELF